MKSVLAKYLESNSNKSNQIPRLQTSTSPQGFSWYMLNILIICRSCNLLGYSSVHTIHNSTLSTQDPIIFKQILCKKEKKTLKPEPNNKFSHSVYLTIILANSFKTIKNNKTIKDCFQIKRQCQNKLNNFFLRLG